MAIISDNTRNYDKTEKKAFLLGKDIYLSVRLYSAPWLDEVLVASNSTASTISWVWSGRTNFNTKEH